MRKYRRSTYGSERCNIFALIWGRSWNFFHSVANLGVSCSEKLEQLISSRDKNWRGTYQKFKSRSVQFKVCLTNSRKLGLIVITLIEGKSRNQLLNLHFSSFNGGELNLNESDGSHSVKCSPTQLELSHFPSHSAARFLLLVINASASKVQIGFPEINSNSPAGAPELDG